MLDKLGFHQVAESEKKYKWFVIGYLVVLSTPIVLLLFSYLFLINAFELRNFTDIVKKQNEKNAIYGSGVDIYYYDYKREFVKQRKPDIMALGSSRALSFHEEVFTVPFTNAGQGMVSLEQGIVFIKDMLQYHKPKAIILSLDFWWFNDRVGGKGYGFTTFDGTKVTLTKLLKPYTLLAEGNISWEDFLTITFLAKKANSLTNFNNLGILAIKTSSGTKSDGSIHWGHSVLTGEDVYDYKFQRGLKYIDDGVSNYEYAQDFSKSRMEELDQIVKLCKDNKIELFIFIPPVAETIYLKMASMRDKYLYIDKLRNYLHDYPVYVNDFHDPDTIHSSNCEFPDHYHGGDVTYLKILLQMSENPKNVGLKKYLKMDLIREMINKFEGNVLVQFDESMYKVQEKDMHNFGCIKQATCIANKAAVLPQLFSKYIITDKFDCLRSEG
ncbi:hypothetical protein D7270_04890 [Legionella pneumophila]|uniref:hypothetical protein n=4 Tax=Legionella pneumophila TaxID=446 RepID=UPI00101E3DA1|nr:hypothetical protein [Legionella pneumophila]HAT8825325.1 hypothetical protein [Legionella pneumophila subsp. pneumophila]MCW8437092.1 hypothetical protein [Legionella pneumophila]MCW8476396.1 hypothetical protein [Legionella pneumophila]MCW8479445.1 hypothetical protein [Legionella pneumophila]MCW8490991.1 hypothetical protein [Legionella pneumophila]